MDKPVPPGYYLTDRSLSFSDSLHLNIEGSMTKHFRDDEGRRWKAWRASRDVFWPEAEEAKESKAESGRESPEGREAVIFVCFSDPSQPQRYTLAPPDTSKVPREAVEEFDEQGLQELLSQTAKL